MTSSRSGPSARAILGEHRHALIQEHGILVMSVPQNIPMRSEGVVDLRRYACSAGNG